MERNSTIPDSSFFGLWLQAVLKQGYDSDIPSIAKLIVGLLFAAHKNPAICVRPIIFIAARTPNGLSEATVS
jgi:hypothetical protein